MPEQHIRIAMPDGHTDAFLFTPENNDAGLTLPGIIDLPDIFSIREATRAMSQRVANEGYLVLAPNPFYRFGPPPLFADVSRDFSKPDTRQRFQELTTPLTQEAIAEDAKAYLRALDENGANPGSIAVIGHCFTGGVALAMAAALPDRIAAVASFHGGGLVRKDDPSSPHLLLPRIKASLYFGHAKDDNIMPAEAIEQLEQALADWGGLYESEVYDAAHGWTVPGSPPYNHTEAERAHAKLVSLLPTIRP